jgi:rhodanese-related sulfurtransferase
MESYLEFAARHPLLVSALLASFFVLVFTELRRKARGFTSIEPQEAVKLINADAVVIDLRSPEAFARGHIVKAKNLPYEDLPANKEKITRYAKKPIVAVCEAGTTSSKVVESLRKTGLDNVYGLKGGINAWTQANLPLVAGKKTKKKS